MKRIRARGGPIVRAVAVAAALLFFAAGGGLRAEAPLLIDATELSDARGDIVRDWRLKAAGRALRTGLAGVAESMYRRALEEGSLTREQRDAVRIGLGAALIAQRRFDPARGVLEQVDEAARGPRFHLYEAAAIYGRGVNVAEAAFDEALDAVREEALERADRPWLYFLRGLRARLSGNEREGAAAFERARERSVSPQQKAFFESMALREEILRSQASEGLAADLRDKLQEYEGRAERFQFAREYSIVLHNLGRTEEALERIDSELEEYDEVYEPRESGQLQLLRGLIAGPDTEEGRGTLRELVRAGRNREVMEIALQLLVRGRSTEDGGAFRNFLDEMIEAADEHPLLGRMYYLRAQLALEQGDTEAAEEDARLLLEQFPGLDEITNVYRLLAFAAVQREPPQYRRTADFLTQARNEIEDDSDRVAVNRLIGDSYFLNGDYGNAVDFYESTRRRSLRSETEHPVFLRLVTAKLRAGQIESALDVIDEADFGGGPAVADRWRAEWNVARALQGRGELERALERVRLLLGDERVSSVPAALDLRLRWLEVGLALMAGEREGILERVDRLLGRIDSIPEGSLDPADARLLRTEILLLKGKALIDSDAAGEGMEVLRGIREEFPESSAAERSFLVETEHHADREEYAAAQEALTGLVENYPESPQAPQALFEAALFSERRGVEHFPDAVRLHNRLAEAYPESGLVFHSRLRQGDLLRKLNNFAGAQTVYENVINRFPEHLLRHVAELARADCMFALAKGDESQLADVALVLERLLDLPDPSVDFQAEVGYKWGAALQSRDAPDEAREVFALVMGRFLLDPENAEKLGERGRYWMARVLLDLGTLWEEAGERREARRIYEKVVEFNLPGKNLARGRVEELRIVED